MIDIHKLASCEIGGRIYFYHPLFSSVSELAEGFYKMQNNGFDNITMRRQMKTPDLLVAFETSMIEVEILAKTPKTTIYRQQQFQNPVGTMFQYPVGGESQNAVDTKFQYQVGNFSKTTAGGARNAKHF